MPLLSNLAIVVPVLNDEAALEHLLLWRRWACPAVPVWVVDGGSVDRSIAAANRYGVQVLEARGGRGAQMNAGALAAIEAGCDVLWFLHADVTPPGGAAELVLQAVQTGAGAGAFRRRFDRPSRWLKFTCWLADWRGRWWGWFLGDQGIFAAADLFTRVGGFPEWPWFEDLEFARRSRRVGPTVLVPATLVASARRFEAMGFWRQTWRDVRATCSYLQSGRPPTQEIDRVEHGDQISRSSADRPAVP